MRHPLWHVEVLFIWILTTGQHKISSGPNTNSGGAFTNSMRCKYTAALMRGGWTHYHMGLLSTNFVSLVSALKIHSWCILTWNRGNGDYENNFSVLLLFPGSINIMSVMLISNLFLCCKKWDTDKSDAWNYKHEGNSPMISHFIFDFQVWELHMPCRFFRRILLKLGSCAPLVHFIRDVF